MIIPNQFIRGIKIEIMCNKHGSFYQSPDKHSRGSGCIKCSHIISKQEKEFLLHQNIKIQNYKIRGWNLKKCDGYEESTNTVYEFLGDYWHGNPEVFDHNKLHPVVKKTYGELYKKTFINFDKLISLGYNVKYIWENDWEKYKKGQTDQLKLTQYCP